MGDMIDRDAVLALLAVGRVKTTYRGKFEPSHKSPQSAAVMEERKRLASAIAALPAAPAEDVRAGALKEALEAMRGAGSAGRTKAEKKAALEQYCLDRDAILALIPEAKP